MATVLPAIDEHLAAWIAEQHMFMVGSAPLSADGHINCSPKGIDSFAVLGSHSVAYQDLTGSGAETIAHLRENGRIVIMFCAFTGPPRIVQLHGRGQFWVPGDERFASLSAHFTPHAGTRAIIEIAVTRIASSCGYAVPEYDYRGQRRVLDDWTDKRTPDQLAEYRQRKNQVSIDGLPALD